MNMRKQKIDTLMETVLIGNLFNNKNKKFMCFRKTEKSKVLRAKKDIVVYKIGVEANKAIFTPYFMTNFSYIAGIKNTTNSNFDISSIKEGFHGYINIALTITVATPVTVVIQKNTKDKPIISIYPTINELLYLGKFIVPKGTTYCLNNKGEVVSDVLIYTGNHIVIEPGKQYDSKELWKEK